MGVSRASHAPQGEASRQRLTRSRSSADRHCQALKISRIESEVLNPVLRHSHRVRVAEACESRHVDPRFYGQHHVLPDGRLVTDIKKRGLTLVPLCPFVAGYLKKHPTWKELVLKGIKMA